jgi:hypothetical protein
MRSSSSATFVSGCEVQPGAASRQDEAHRVRAQCCPGTSGSWCRQTRDIRLPRLHAHLREDEERTVLVEAQDHFEADAGEAGRGQGPTPATHASPHSGTGALVGKRGARAPRLLRRAWQHRRGSGLPYPGDTALVQGVTASKPAQPSQLDPDEPLRGALATACPCAASLPKHAFRRHHPRQEPSAVVPHAGICAGGRPKGRSLPRSRGLSGGCLWEGHRKPPPHA